MNAPHPSVVTLDHRSRPRVLFSGDQLVEVSFPPGTRVIYPKKPMTPLQDVDAAIRYALHHPLGSAPLYARLKPGMKLTIAVDDLSMPLPPMKTPDIRGRVVTAVLDLCASYGVTDIDIIIATAFHRPMTQAEIRHILGDKIVDRFWPDHLYNHDAEKPGGLTYLGRTEDGQEVEINRRAAESDLVVYVNLTFVPMNGGHKSLATGLVGYRTLKGHHNPHTIRSSPTYMDPTVSALSDRMVHASKLIQRHVPVFHIESTVNTAMFDSTLSFLCKNEDELTGPEQVAMRGLIRSLQILPQPARQAIFERVPAPYGVIGVWAGETEAVHEATLQKCYQQLLVPVDGQADIAVFPVPYVSPYSVGAYLNPLLVSVMVQGYLFNLHKTAPLVKRGGTVIVTHPCTDKFDWEQHASYVEFFHKLLPRTRDAMELHKKYEAEFARNPAYIQMYRTGKGYHPAHPFYMWYWGENGRQYIGRVIVVGADNEYVPKILGYETAGSMAEALRMARETAPPKPSISVLRISPLMMVDVNPDVPAPGVEG